MVALAFMLCSLVAGGGAQARTNVNAITITNVAVNANHTVTIKVRIRGLKLAPALVGKTNVTGKRHWHIYVNGKANNDAVTTSGKTKPLQKGVYTMYVTLNDNDHSPLSEPTRWRPITVMVG